MKCVSKFMAEELNSFFIFGHNVYGHGGGHHGQGGLVAVKRKPGVSISESVFTVLGTIAT